MSTKTILPDGTEMSADEVKDPELRKRLCEAADEIEGVFTKHHLTRMNVMTVTAAIIGHMAVHYPDQTDHMVAGFKVCLDDVIARNRAHRCEATHPATPSLPPTREPGEVGS